MSSISLVLASFKMISYKATIEELWRLQVKIGKRLADMVSTKFRRLTRTESPLYQICNTTTTSKNKITTRISRLMMTNLSSKKM